MPKPHGYWSLERCREDAAKYQLRQDWIKKSNGAYDAAWRHGWLDECCQHMPQVRRPHGFWGKEKCAEDALRFKSRAEWERASPSAYGVARKNRWIDFCCSHMQRGRVPN